MLESLRIENFAIIDKLEVDFKKGLNCIVGPTGAGKTIIIEALGLILGTRAEFSKIKDETKKSVVEANFILDESFVKSHPYLKDYVNQDNSLAIARILTPSKQAQVRINGELANLNLLKRITTNLIDIFSQNESSYLLNPSIQLQLLDNYSAEIKPVKDEFNLEYLKLEELNKQIEDFKKSINLDMKDFYKYQIDEIESYKLKENEIEDLNSQKEEMSKYDQTISAFKDFSSTYYINDQVNVNDILNRLETSLNELSDTMLGLQASKAKENINILQDSLDEIFTSFDNLDFSTSKLDQINQRLFNLTTLQRKYGKQTSQILSSLNDLKTKYDNIVNFDYELEKLQTQKEAILAKLNQLAINLSSLRKKAATSLKNEVNKQLGSLELKEDGFDIRFESQNLNSTGIDKIEFVVSLNNQNKYLPLKQVLSGGENSRLNLALKTVFNNASNSDTLVFDEIDSGISGSIGYKAGLKMVEISKKSMVIVITHLGQVLSLADQGYLVYKQKGTNNEVSSNIKQMSEEELIYQIGAISSSSTSISSNSLSLAKELREKAILDKKKI